MAYFPHVDGLRAVAVMGVIFAHYHIPGFPGGFLGVDVFFVISGYLITRMIAQEKGRTGTFSYRRFYIRRIRRLMPAAFATIALTLVAFYPILGPSDLKSLLRSVPFVLASLANFNYYSEVGYFDTAAQFKPLLHTWSLAVEEQFYLIWPTLLLLALRFRRFLFAFSIALAGASVLAAELRFSEDFASVYYLLPFRAFELLVGSVLAIIMADQSPCFRDIHLGTRMESALAFVGLALVIISFLAFDETSRLPGVLSLVPCFGTALIIAYGQAGGVGKFLTFRPIIWIGLISYSLYLVHWPIMVYVSYRLPDMPSLEVRLILVPVAIALGAISHRFIEEPFRRPARPERRFGNIPAFAGLGAVAVALCVPTLDYVFRLREALPDKLEALNRETPTVHWRGREQVGDHALAVTHVAARGRDASRRILILGDSHAGHLAAGAHHLAAQGALVDIVSQPSCPALFGAVRFTTGDAGRKQLETRCRNSAEARRTVALSDKYDTVILASQWYPMFEPRPEEIRMGEEGLVALDQFERPSIGQSRDLFVGALRATIRDLKSTGKEVVVFSQVPPLGNDLTQCMSIFAGVEAEEGSRCYRLSRDLVSERAEFTDRMIAAIAREEGALAVLPQQLFCTEVECLLEDPDTGEFLYKDRQHLSQAGSIFLMKRADERYDVLDEMHSRVLQATTSF